MCSLSSSGNSQVSPSGTTCASPPSPGWWDGEDLLSCRLSAEVALLHIPTVKVLMLFLHHPDRREENQLLLVGDLAAWFQEQGNWGAGRGQEESEGKGEVRTDKALNQFTLFATPLERK